MLLLCLYFNSKSKVTNRVLDIIIKRYINNSLWINNTLNVEYNENYEVKELLVQIFDKGRLVYEEPDIEDIKKTCREQIDTLWGEMLRFENPQTYYVDLSQNLWDLKHELLKKHGSDNL